MKRRRIARSRVTTNKGVPPAAAAATVAAAAAASVSASTTTAGAMRMARKCCVRNCGMDVQEARLKGLPLHKFPKDPVLRGRWLASGGFDANFKATPAQVVCHRHFKRADYEVAKASKLTLKKGSVPSVFKGYDNHPDPVIMSVKSSTSYAQEDLDLINAEILNMRQSPLLSEDKVSKPETNSESSNLEVKSSIDSVNSSEKTNLGESKLKSVKETTNFLVNTNKESLIKKSDIEVNSMAIQLGIVEPEIAMPHVPKDLILKDELNGFKMAEEKEYDKPEDLRPKALNRGNLKFYPGAKLEAKDFNEKWYSAKVVETDWAEREVLIHFDKWSTRFDEWIPMDSSRLRVLQTPPKETKMREFSVGEKILATWADGRKYPAKVNAVLGNDRYDVLFDDGYAKVVRSSKMTKITNATTTPQSVQDEGYIGSKQERRDKKRKHTIMELFHTHSRKRSKPDTEKQVKKETAHDSSTDYLTEPKVDLDGTMYGPCYDPGTDLLKGFDPNIPKIKNLSSKKTKKEIPKSDTEQEDIEWIDGEPQGIESFIVDGSDGPRRSIIVPDKRLPPGWQKHFTQRKTGTSAGKWDVLFIHKPSGKKFRTRNDIKFFLETQGQFDFDPDKFDFRIHRKKIHTMQKVKQDTSTLEVPKKIKTLLPKTKTPTTNENTLVTPSSTVITSTATTPVTSVSNGAVFIGGLRVEMEDSAYKCPKQGCNKNFRKENLLQMHIKHYHPEYSKFLGSTPNVADLAYARTIGESIDDIIPKKSTPFIDRINKYGKKKPSQDKSPMSIPQVTTNIPPPISPSVSLSMPEDNEEETDHTEKTDNLQKEDIKAEAMSPISSHSTEIEEDIEKKRENACAMSPGTLFDMKVREEKTQVGIKTLLPVRPAINPPPEAQRTDRSKSLDDPTHIERTKGHRKRQLSEYSSDVPTKGKKQHGMQELVDDYGDMDESAVDTEGPSASMYRYSRRKSDSKSDENSQNSQLNDSRLDKGDPFKGDSTKRDNNDTEESESVMMMINGEMVKVEQLRREEIINCTCGFMEEDGLMIQCDLCLCWQHGHCNAIEKETDVPEKYVCYICRHPYRGRPSKKYFHDQDWIKEGKLPSLPNRTKNQSVINQRTAMLKRSYDLVAALLQIQQLLHSLRVKINVAQKKDHPKLYLWAKNWEKMEIPKPNTKPVPVMEITKLTNDFTNNSSESSRRTDIKVETKIVTKNGHDEKSITSASELMKILEDSTNSNESKVTSKKDGAINRNDSHILLDALTRNGIPDEKQKSLENEVENINPQITTGGSKSAMFGNNMHEESSVSEFVPDLALPQPFIPEPEAPIDSAECRMRLLEHIEHFQNHIDSRLISIEAQVCALEAMDPDEFIPNADVQPRTKQTVQMLLRDLNTVRKLAALC